MPGSNIHVVPKQPERIPPQRAGGIEKMSRHYLSPGLVTRACYAWRDAENLTEKGVADNISETPTRVVSAVLRTHDRELMELRALVYRALRRTA